MDMTRGDTMWSLAWELLGLVVVGVVVMSGAIVVKEFVKELKK